MVAFCSTISCNYTAGPGFLVFLPGGGTRARGAGRGARDSRARIFRRTQHLLPACSALYFSGLTKSRVNPCSCSGAGTQVPEALPENKRGNDDFGWVGRGQSRERDSLTLRRDQETTDRRHLWFSAAAAVEAAAAAVVVAAIVEAVVAAAVVKEEEEQSGRWYQGLTMDEEYDVIVLGTGLTVSATSGAHSPASCHPSSPHSIPH